MIYDSSALPEELEILKREFELTGINLNMHEWINSKLVLEEIRFVLIPRIHEGACYSYGVVFANNADDFEDHSIIRMNPDSIHLARKMANGVDWFILYHKTEFQGLIHLDEGYSNEVKLIQNFPISGGLIAHRNRHGVSKIFLGDSIWIHEQRNWSFRPNIKKASSNISHCFEKIDKKIMNQILEFAFYMLSPSPKTGAIIVWSASNGEHSNNELSALNLNLTDDSKKKMIFHLLSQTDGATMIDSNGRITEYGVHLHYSKKSASIIGEYRGSRHTTSIRYSYDAEDAIVFTISEDGPVSIFINGVNITDLELKTAHKMARDLKLEQPELADSLIPKSFIVLCNHCNRSSMIEEVVIKNLNTRTQVACPTCKKMIYNSNTSFVNCRPFRPL